VGFEDENGGHFYAKKATFSKKIRNYGKKPQLFGLFDVYIYTGIGFPSVIP